MKELTTEQKAKRYDEALTKARNIVNSINVGLIGKDSFEAVFPELKESKDERIRKSLLDYLYTLPNHFSHNGGLVTDWIAWLEKQGEKFDDINAKRMFIKALERVEEQNNKGYKLTDCDKNSWWEDFKTYASCTVEQNPADKAESKFHEGDWVVYNNDICQIVKREEGCNKLVTVFGIEKELVNERNLSTARLWTIQDAKDGDVLTVDDVIFIYERTLAKHIVSYCKLINGIFESIIDARTCCEGNTYVHPATKEQRDTLFARMKEAGYEWDANKKELKMIEKKPAEWNKQQVVNALTSMLTEKIKPLTKKISDGTISDREEMFRTALIEIRSFVNSPSFQIGKDVSVVWSKEDEKYLSYAIHACVEMIEKLHELKML